MSPKHDYAGNEAFLVKNMAMCWCTKVYIKKCLAKKHIHTHTKKLSEEMKMAKEGQPEAGKGKRADEK